VGVVPAQPAVAAAPPSKLTSFLKVSGEYKEFAALVAFCVGGVFWAFAYFASKQQLLETRCLLNTNISFIQARMDSSNLSQLMVENLKEGVALDAKTALSPDEILKRNQLKTAAADIARKLADADNASAQSLSKLRSGDCSAN